MDRESFPQSLKGKKVLLTTESLGPVNGVSRTTGSLIDYLRRNEVDLMVVAPKFAGAQQAEQPEANLRLPGYPLPYNPDLTLVYPFRLKDIYKEPAQPDIVYVASPASLGFQLLLYLRQLRKPPVVLLNFQTDLSAYSEIILPSPLSRWSVWLLAVVQGFLFSNPAVHTIFYPSSSILRYLKDAGAPATRAVKLGRGVDTILFHPSRRDEAFRKEIAPDGEIILVCVCRLALEKGFEFLAVAAAKLAEEKLPFKLLIVGGNRNPEVERNIHRLFDTVRDHVIFTGFLTGEPLARAYASGDLFLHCSITGLLVPPNDIETFVALVRQVSRDSQLLASLALAARTYAEDTTWEKINRRVAQQMADAVEAREQAKRLQLEGQGRWCAAYEKAKDRTMLALIQRIRLIAAFGFVSFMWMISVIPLIVHGSRVIPRSLAHIRGLASSRK
ncbi:hypothetical protein CNMCM8812_005514 [Aspergillus fumigatus]|nr:hypothetical protein CNMCM8812_005514 [Aspergillus fumigatus]